MNDRELLELAAKAAGMGELVFMSEEDRYVVVITPAGGSANTWRFWNPLDDDGDALRLAMRLGFTVEMGRCWHSPYGPVFGEDVLSGELKSTRRAIVRAAASIGEGMP